MQFVVIAVAAAVVYFALSRANELFCISVRDGRVLVIRGAVPPNLLHSLADIVRRQRVERGTIRAIRASGHARLLTSGIDEGTTQRMRNAFGINSISKLRAASRPSARNLGQWLGITWLAWLLSPKR